MNERKLLNAGSIIEYCGDEFIVVKDYGSSLKVRDLGTDETSSTFSIYWTAYGATCTVVSDIDDVPQPKESNQ